MTDWVITLARHVEVSPAMLVDPPVARRATDDLLASLAAEVLSRPATTTAGPTTFVLTSRWGTAVVIAEVRALDRLTPNPFPTLIPFPRLARLTAWLQTQRKRGPHGPVPQAG